MKTTTILVLMLAGVVPLTSQALAGRLEVSPTETALVPAAVGQPARAVVRFDVSGVPVNAVVDEALLEGEVALAAGGSAMLSAYLVAESWSATPVVSGAAAVAAAEEPAADWEIAPADQERSGGFLRLDLTEATRAWRVESAPNHGVLITAEGVSSEALQSCLAQLRLVILYSE